MRPVRLPHDRLDRGRRVLLVHKDRHSPRERTMRVPSSFVPKVELAIVVREHDAPAAIKAIVGRVRTGRIGDGKILVLPCYEEYLCW